MTPRKPKGARQLGVTDEEYERMLEAQGGGCAICERKPKTRRLHVDHDHATGEVRALLCHRCNRALPTWVTVDWLMLAAMYLRDCERRAREREAKSVLVDQAVAVCEALWGPKPDDLSIDEKEAGR